MQILQWGCFLFRQRRVPFRSLPDQCCNRHAKPFALPLCIFDQSVTKTISIHSSYFLDYFGSFSIFKTNEGAFWSEFLGTMLTPERTETYSRRRFPILAVSGGVLPRRNSRYEGTTVHRIEKPLYEARVFSALKEKCLIFYNVYSNRKSRKQLRW